MNYKTRKRIWPVSFAAALGVVAMLALLTATVLMPGAAQAQTAPTDPLELVAPTAVSATANSDTQITLSWTAASGGGGRGVTGYMVQRKSGTGAFAAVSPAHTGTATMYVDTGLTPSTSYTYQVQAMRSATDIGPWSADASAMTTAAGTLGTPVTVPPATGDMIKSDSTSGGGAPEFQVVIESLPDALAVGSSIVLYLEDDYQEPETIPASSVYFVATPPTEKTGNGARVYTTIAPRIDTNAYFDADKKDISIRVFIPDMCTSSTDACQGPNGVDANQKLTMVVEDNSGIKNPTEAGSHSAAYKILDPTQSVPGPAEVDKDYELKTVAKISLSDVNNSRGYQLTVTGSGFNDGTTATAWVLGRKPTTAEWWDELDCAEMNALVMGKTPTPVDTNEPTGWDTAIYTAVWTLIDMTVVDGSGHHQGLRRNGCLPGRNRPGNRRRLRPGWF